MTTASETVSWTELNHVKFGWVAVGLLCVEIVKIVLVVDVIIRLS